MANEKTARIKISAVDKLSATIDRLKEKFPQLNKSINESNLSFQKLKATTASFKGVADNIGKPMQNIGRALTLGVTLPAIAAGTLALKAFTDYETALVGVGKTTNIEGANLQKLGQKFIDLSKTIPTSATELMGLGQTAAQLGVTGEGNILKFSETLAKLASATNIVGEEGAADLARFIKVTKGSLGDVDRFGSALVDLGNTSAATEAEILSFSTRLAASTALFGLSGTQVLGMATTMKSLGLEAEAGSSAVQRSLGEINKVISAGGQKMQVLSKLTGIAMGDLKTKFKTDAAGTLLAFAQGLARLEAKGGDVTQAMAFFGMEGVRDLQVIGALSKNTQMLEDKMKQAGAAFDTNKALAKEFSAAIDTTAAKTKVTWNQVTALAIKLGEQLAPAFGWVLEKISAIVGFLDTHPFLAKMGVAVTALVAILGPLILAFGTLLTMIPGMIAGWAALTATLVPLAVAAWAAIAPFLVAAAPFILIGAAIIGLVAIIWIFRDAIIKGIVFAFDWALEKLYAFWDVLKSIGKDMASVFGFGDKNINVNAKTNPLPNGQALMPQGAAVGGLEVQSKSNPEFSTQTNNARVDINVRAPQSTSVKSESQGGFLSINRGMAGAF
jgi:TP901 family phage tail tape measure protein